ncbi:MAG TPA: fibronectin type III domain-containing protein, partial [Elusimicrobiales bacterium]|nr:fibronectin type III domain-containing protein [Elusimicrobiales bacterium]
MLTGAGGFVQSFFPSENYVLVLGLGDLMAWPRTVTDLSASTGPADGSVLLSWTSPAADGSTGTAAAYELRYSSVPVEAPALDEARFFLSASVTDFAAVPAPGAPGSAEQLSVPGLEGGATYYFAIKARSSWDAWSYLSVGATAQARLHAPVFSGFSGVGEGSVRIDWSCSGNVSWAGYRVLASTAPDPLAPGGAQVTSSDTYNTYLSSSGLSADTTYYFRVAAIIGNGASISYYTAPRGISTLADVPSAAGFADVEENAMVFGWSPNGNSGGTLYRVAFSTAPD